MTGRDSSGRRSPRATPACRRPRQAPRRTARCTACPAPQRRQAGHPASASHRRRASPPVSLERGRSVTQLLRLVRSHDAGDLRSGALSTGVQTARQPHPGVSAPQPHSRLTCRRHHVDVQDMDDGTWTCSAGRRVDTTTTVTVRRTRRDGTLWLQRRFRTCWRASCRAASRRYYDRMAAAQAAPFPGRPPVGGVGRR